MEARLGEILCPENVANAQRLPQGAGEPSADEQARFFVRLKEGGDSRVGDGLADAGMQDAHLPIV